MCTITDNNLPSWIIQSISIKLVMHFFFIDCIFKEELHHIFCIDELYKSVTTINEITTNHFKCQYLDLSGGNYLVTPFAFVVTPK